MLPDVVPKGRDLTSPALCQAAEISDLRHFDASEIQ